MSGMRGLRFEICLGDDAPDNEWHIYHLAGRRYVDGYGVQQIAKHLGALDGGTQDWPPGTKPAD
jgi:hypothetical protein